MTVASGVRPPCIDARSNSASNARRFGSDVSKSACVRIACICDALGLLGNLLARPPRSASARRRWHREFCVTALATPVRRLDRSCLPSSPVIFCSRWPCPLMSLASSAASTSSDERTWLYACCCRSSEANVNSKPSELARQSRISLSLVVERAADVVALVLHETVRFDDRFGQLGDDGRLGRMSIRCSSD